MSIRSERNHSGFSAFELACALAIMAVIAAFVMPQYLKWLRAYRLRGATTNLVADLEMAKVRAIRENAFVAVHFETDGYTIFVDNGEGAGISGDSERNGSEQILRNRDLPAGVSINMGALTFADNRTRFNARGIPPDVVAKEEIRLTNTIRSKLITMNRLGYMNVQ